MDRPLKVLMVGNDSSVLGGITSVINQLMAHDWTKENVEMKFIPTYVDTNLVKKIFFFEKSYRKIKHELKSSKPDVVHIHMSYRGSFVRKYRIHKLCMKCGVDDVIHLHGSEFKKWYDQTDSKTREQIKSMLRECKAFLVLGENWKETIREIEPSTNILVVSNTVSIPESSVNWSQPLKVLFLGVLIKRKGVADLLEAIRLLRDRGDAGNLSFAIAGSGQEEEALIEKAKEYDLLDKVDFLGWTDGEKKERLLSECQALVLPSYNEGLPVAILEAISHGMPVIATNVGDISSAVIDGYNGYLIEPSGVEALADSLKKLASSKDLYEQMSANSKKLAKERFSDERYFELLTDCYRKG